MRSFSVSRSYLVMEDEGVREEKTRSNNTFLCISHLGATLHSGLRACMAYGIWHMAYVGNARTFFFFHPPNNTDTQTDTHIHHRHRLSR